MFLPFFFLYYQEGLYLKMDQFPGGRSVRLLYVQLLDILLGTYLSIAFDGHD